MDTELKALFVEIRTKDWEQELDTFRYDLQIEKMNRQRFSLEFLSKHSQLFIPILTGFILGMFISAEVALSLYIFLLIVLCIGIVSLKSRCALVTGAIVAIIGGAFFVVFLPLVMLPTINAIVFKSLTGACFGAMFSYAMLSRFDLDITEVLPFLKSFEMKEEFPLKPDELLRFWESNMGVYLERKQTDLKVRSKIVYAKKEELNQLLLELSEYSDIEDSDAKRSLERGFITAQKTEQDIANISEILILMKKNFLIKISKLKTLIEEQKTLELKQIKKQTLHLRISEALNSSQGQTNTWELEKQTMQLELRSIMNVFREQILQSGDFFQAQMDLIEQKEGHKNE